MSTRPMKVWSWARPGSDGASASCASAACRTPSCDRAGSTTTSPTSIGWFSSRAIDGKHVVLTGPDGGFITGSDVLMDGGVTAECWYGDGAEARTQ
jgi:hypothetical protein